MMKLNVLCSVMIIYWFWEWNKSHYDHTFKATINWTLSNWNRVENKWKINLFKAELHLDRSRLSQHDISVNLESVESVNPYETEHKRRGVFEVAGRAHVEAYVQVAMGFLERRGKVKYLIISIIAFCSYIYRHSYLSAYNFVWFKSIRRLSAKR